MKLLGVFLFVHVADISAQLISDQQTSPGFIQIQSKNRTQQNIPSSRTSGESGSVMRGRTTTGFNNNRRGESIGQKEASVKGNRRTDQAPKVFTNVSQGNNVKYIQRIEPSSDPDKIIFYDDVNYDREPFTNERKPEDHFTYNTGSSRGPSATPYSGIPNSSGQQYLNSSKGTSNADYNISYNEAEGTLNNKGEEGTTTEGFELDNRVAFTGDGCATGLVKVRGKCIKEIK